MLVGRKRKVHYKVDLRVRLNAFNKQFKRDSQRLAFLLLLQI